MEDKDGKRTLTCNSQGVCPVQDHRHFDEIKTRIFLPIILSLKGSG